MKSKHLTFASTLIAAMVVTAGCGRQSRGNADATEQSRAANPEEGGNSSTAASAGQAKNFGDTSRSGAHGGVTPTETPKVNNTRESNEPAKQPQKSTKDQAESTP